MRSAYSSGVTLIEVLVAITIFSVLGIMSYRAITQAVNSQERLSVEFADWQNLARTLSRVEADLQQIGSRYNGSPGGQAPLLLSTLPDGGSRIVFWRLDAELGARLTGFEYAEGSFELLRWTTADITQPPKREKLLTGVKSVTWGFVAAKNATWLTSWPPTPAQSSELPVGIRIDFDLEKFGKISRNFAIN